MVYGPTDGQRAVERHGFTHEQGAEDPVNGSLAWPVGSVFISVVTTNPSILLGFGTWSQIAAGKFLIGVDTGTAAYDTVEETGGNGAFTHSSGGADTLTHTNNHSGAAVTSHSNHRHTAAVGFGTTAGADGNTWQQDVSPQSSLLVDEGSTALSHSVTQPSAHADHSVSGHTHDAHPLPPFFAVYMWKRTA